MNIRKIVDIKSTDILLILCCIWSFFCLKVECTESKTDHFSFALKAHNAFLDHRFSGELPCKKEKTEVLKEALELKEEISELKLKEEEANEIHDLLPARDHSFETKPKTEVKLKCTKYFSYVVGVGVCVASIGLGLYGFYPELFTEATSIAVVGGSAVGGGTALTTTLVALATALSRQSSLYPDAQALGNYSLPISVYSPSSASDISLPHKNRILDLTNKTPIELKVDSIEDFLLQNAETLEIYSSLFKERTLTWGTPKIQKIEGKLDKDETIRETGDTNKCSDTESLSEDSAQGSSYFYSIKKPVIKSLGFLSSVVKYCSNAEKSIVWLKKKWELKNKWTQQPTEKYKFIADEAPKFDAGSFTQDFIITKNYSDFWNFVIYLQQSYCCCEKEKKKKIKELPIEFEYVSLEHNILGQYSSPIVNVFASYKGRHILKHNHKIDDKISHSYEILLPESSSSKQHQRLDNVLHVYIDPNSLKNSKIKGFPTEKIIIKEFNLKWHHNDSEHKSIYKYLLHKDKDSKEKDERAYGDWIDHTIIERCIFPIGCFSKDFSGIPEIQPCRIEQKYERPDTSTYWWEEGVEDISIRLAHYEFNHDFKNGKSYQTVEMYCGHHRLGLYTITSISFPHKKITTEWEDDEINHYSKRTHKITINTQGAINFYTKNKNTLIHEEQEIDNHRKLSFFSWNNYEIPHSGNKYR